MKYSYCTRHFYTKIELFSKGHYPNLGKIVYSRDAMNLTRQWRYTKSPTF